MLFRKHYVEQINKYKKANLIKILTGVRRSGKSTIFELYASQLVKDGIQPQQIQMYNFENPLTIRELGREWEDIFFSIYDKLDKESLNYIFLDEIQNIKSFERLVDGLFTQKNVDLYLTGSNAYLLSSELATLLTGRAIEIHVLPYSFQEYVQATDDLQSKSKQELFFQNYFMQSSFPESVLLQDQGRDVVANYVESVYRGILEKDIYPRIKDVNRRVFENVFKFVLANIGSEISPNNISKALKRDGVIVSHVTVSDYLNKLCDSYLLYQVSRFDVRGKQQLATLEKYYVPDLGILSLLVGRRDAENRGHLLENLVYFELLRRGGQVWVGKINRVEVDFVVKKNDGTLEYYQVSYTLADDATYEREITPLKQIRDAYPKTIITADLFNGNQEGIYIKNIVDWLLEAE